MAVTASQLLHRCLPAETGMVAHACSGEPLEGWTVYEGVRFLNDDPGGAPIELRAGTCVHVAMASPEQLAVAAVQQVLKVQLQTPAGSLASAASDTHMHAPAAANTHVHAPAASWNPHARSSHTPHAFSEPTDVPNRSRNCV